ncbi:uncharacterized protein LOC109861632 [Pseudomyrmex gracilis]|uniref:uncharacterized protein LOC109861632 n=1 Tax=Pseudomyrmex gracilis TaxID=219809 RepID=UPI0009959FD7|nr:uncharacterized protein LOC109861632 [Pseudomyrmex gracilis]
MERMISCRLSWWLEWHGLLPGTQFGFCRQKSCVDNLTLLYGEILGAFQEDSAVAAAFLDIQGAYDNVLSDILLNNLLLLGVPQRTQKFIWHLTSSRQLFFRFGELELYADDVCLYSSEFPVEEALRSVELAVEETNLTLGSLGLTLSAPKTQLCVFSPGDRALKSVIDWDKKSF